MEKLASLSIYLCKTNHGISRSEEQIRKRWEDWASKRTNATISFLDPCKIDSIKEENRSASSHRPWFVSPWNRLISFLCRKEGFAADAVLAADQHLRPNGSLFRSIQVLMEKKAWGWWFSVKPTAFYFHNILIKQGYLVRNFEMDGLFSIDNDKAMFFNHVTERHFLHSQDAPDILQSDGGLCFINTSRFDRDNSFPYEFHDTDYHLG